MSCYNSLLHKKKHMIIGRKGIEPLTALAIEFTAQPVIPTNGTFLYIFLSLKRRGVGLKRVNIIDTSIHLDLKYIYYKTGA